MGLDIAALAVALKGKAPPTARQSLFQQAPRDLVMPTRSVLTPEARLILRELHYESSDPGNTPSMQCAPLMQEFLNSCHLVALALGGTGLNNLMFRAAVRAVFPFGYYALRDALVIPPYVEVDFRGKVVRQCPSGGTISTSWDGTYQDSLSNSYRPAIIMSSVGMVDNLNLYLANSDTNLSGVGLAVGKNWSIASVAINDGGTGYTVGDTLYTAIGLPAPYIGAQLTVSSVDGSGKITGLTLLDKGAYGFPLQIQKAIWTSANGFNVFTGNFSHKLTGGTGVGASVVAAWEPDYQNGTYRPLKNLTGDSYIHKLRMHGGGMQSGDATYGSKFGIGYFGLNHTFNEIQVVGGYFGFHTYFANDIRGNILNTVLCGTAVNLFAVGSMQCDKVVTDSSRDADLRMDRCSSIDLTITSFFATGNTAYVSPLGAPLRIGAQSSGQGQMNDNCTIRAKFIDRGAASNGTQRLATLAYSRNCTFDLEVSNGNRNSGAVFSINEVAQIGTYFDGSNTVRGRADKIIGPLFTGTGLAANDSGPRCNVNFWDDSIAAKMGWGGRYDIKAAGVPVSGNASIAATGNTSVDSAVISGLSTTTGIVAGMTAHGSNVRGGARVLSIGAGTVTLDAPATATANGVNLTFKATGLNKTPLGSTFIDVTNGNQYINVGLPTSPDWKLLTRAA